MWKEEFCNFKPIRPFSAAPCLIRLISLGTWGKVIVTKLILYKTIFVSYWLHFLLSDYFTIKETHPDTVFIFLCKAQHDRLCIFAVLQVIFLFFGYFQYNFSLYNHYLNNVQLYLFTFLPSSHSSKALKQLTIIPIVLCDAYFITGQSHQESDKLIQC